MFRDNAIDVAVLPELSEADLENLGVLLGHRKIMLRAIAALRGGAAENIAEPVPASAPLPRWRLVDRADRDGALEGTGRRRCHDGNAAQHRGARRINCQPSSLGVIGAWGQI